MFVETGVTDIEISEPSLLVGLAVPEISGDLFYVFFAFLLILRFFHDEELLHLFPDDLRFI